MNKTQEKICHLLKRYNGSTFSTSAVAAELGARNHQVSESTVRRNLNFLVRAKVVSTVKDIRGNRRYWWSFENVGVDK